jgi:hypothetical protein
MLPDTYTLTAQDGETLGLASISSIHLSIELRKHFADQTVRGLPVQVQWNPSFRKYQIHHIMPEDTPITTASFFHHAQTQ